MQHFGMVCTREGFTWLLSPLLRWKRRTSLRGWKQISEGGDDGYWELITFHACHGLFGETLFSLQVELYFTVRPNLR